MVVKMMAKSIRVCVGILIGGAAGYAYYRFVGCRTGACPLTGNPYISTAYGAMMGLLVGLS